MIAIKLIFWFSVALIAYVLVTASLAAGLWDWLSKGTPPTWERAQGRV
jgi:hypothetical protein